MIDMTECELRTQLTSLLRRVESGEPFRVILDGRPVAKLVPIEQRPQSIPWSALMRDRDRWMADPGLAKELRELLPDTTDDLPYP